MKHKYGKWVYDQQTETLIFPINEAHDYEIDLNGITRSSIMLDWIMQINAKVWGRGECVADLVAAFESIFRPQKNLCPFGRDQRINAAEYLTRRRK